MIYVLGGGTFSHVRSHLALAAPAFGQTAKDIHDYLRFGLDTPAELVLTKMADSSSKIVTNEDVSVLIDELIADPATKMIVLNVALCDYDGSILDRSQYPDGYDSYMWEPTPSGKYETRLKTKDGEQDMRLTPADKIVGRIRKERKDIFVVAFKTTSGATSDEQYSAGLHLLKANSANLVLANDLVTRNNMVITPEESRHYETTNRGDAIKGLMTMALQRSQNTFTRSTVVEGAPIAWNSPDVPENLRAVVDHCIARGAYKPFREATVGHFAVKVADNRIYTSRRKRNFNNLPLEGLVEVEYDGLDKVIAKGGKPSVGGQSQRIVFDQHPDLDCIVHAHVPMRTDAPDLIPVADQKAYECGSHQCGENTSRNLSAFDHGIHAVMLDEHGPNIVFSRNTPAEAVINFIERNFDLEGKTGGLVS